MSGLDWLMWGATFVGIVILTHGALLAYGNRQKIRLRLKGPVGSSTVTVLKEQEVTNPLLRRLFSRLSPYGKLTQKDEEETKIQSLLINGGFRNPNANTIFYGIKALVALILPVPFMLFFVTQEKLNPATIMVSFAIGAMGYCLPLIFLQKIVKNRQDRLDRALPDVIDLFIICMEAGLALQATINRVAEEIRAVCLEFHEELQIVAGEMRTGISRETALKNLGRRTGVQSIQSLVTLMLQSEKLGTSLAQSLRAHADFSRVQRTLRAEEMAAKLPVKIVIPLVLFILPAMFIVIIGPGAIEMAKTLLPLLMGKG